jgi:hypothetical protein
MTYGQWVVVEDGALRETESAQFDPLQEARYVDEQ